MASAHAEAAPWAPESLKILTRHRMDGNRARLMRIAASLKDQRPRLRLLCAAYEHIS